MKFLNWFQRVKNKTSEPALPSQGGFIALMSVLIISVTLLGISFTRSNNGFFARFGVLDSEYKRVGLGLAESCANVALLKISEDYNYDYLSDGAYNGAKGGVVVPIDPSASPATECIIKSVIFGAEDIYHQKVATITTKAEYKGTWSNMKIAATVQNPNFAIVVRGIVTVVLHVINDDGGTKQAGDFTLSVSPGSLNPSPATFGGSETGTTVYVNAGSYNVFSNNLSGYTQTSSSDCSSSITAGAAKVCTITQNDIPTTATLTLVANVINDNGGTKQPSDFSLFIDGVATASGVPVNNLSPGTHNATKTNLSGYSSSSWGYHCTISGSVGLNAGDNKTCVITFDDTAPPAPVCAETVMMLDRTGSMKNNNGPGGSYTGSDLGNERDAANALINLYSSVVPQPLVGVGVFGDGTDDNGFAPAQIVGQMSNAYSTLTSTINSWLLNSSGYTNLYDAINKGSGELNSVRHQPGKAQVLILVSDGEANRPNGSVTTSTPLVFPISDAPNAPGDNWTNAPGAKANGGTDATNNNGNRHAFYNFGLSVPTGSTISGIEIVSDAWSTGGNVNINTDTGYKSPTANTSDTGGNGNGFESGASNAYANAGSSATNSNNTGDRHRYYNYNFSVPSGVTSINGIEVRPDWWIDNTSGTNSIGIELSWNGGTTWTTVKSENTETIWDTNSKTVGGPNDLWGRTWALSDFTNSNFRLRVSMNSSSSSRDFSLDWIPVKIYYTISAPSSGCELGVDLSWNSGSSWSNEKIQDLTGVEATYTMGSPSDLWSSHAWQPGDFAANKFVARVRDIDGGASCQDTATTHLDALQAKVYYTTPNDPTALTLDAVDQAKLAGVNVFTIHFGNDPNGYLGKDFLANLANGSSLVSYKGVSHQNGSANDMSSTPSFGDTGLQVATATVTPSQWNTSDKAFISDNQYATENTNGEKQGYGNFGLNVPAGTSIKGVEVEVEMKSTDANGCQLGVEVSPNNGVSYTSSSSNRISITSTNDNTYTIGNSSSTWGRIWNSTDFANGKFAVRLENIDPGNNCTNGSTTSVDRIRTRIYYSSIPENTDGDNFFVSPSSSDMTDIFQAIGTKVCPALGVTPTPPPTKANLFIITNVLNNNGGVLNSDDFTSLLSASNPLPVGSPAGSYKGVAAPGINITIDPGSYNVDQASMTGYTKNLGIDCSGSINAGAAKTCTINNDDIQPISVPPAIPPPLTNIIIGSWSETP